MTIAQMRKIPVPNLLRKPQSYSSPTTSTHLPFPGITHTTFFSQCRSLAQLQSEREMIPDIWFTSTSLPRRGPAELGDRTEVPIPDERTLKLGKTIRILQSRLPTLLASPLPQEILSPHISLHLFPSTHPHLPTVSGRVAYSAALWTAPVAWGRVPIVGNVKLIILSERMVNNGGSTPTTTTATHHASHERLIVRWKTCGKTKGMSMGMSTLYRGIKANEQVPKITDLFRHSSSSSSSSDGRAADDDDFSGLFIFAFDEAGRIMTHTIEHAEEGGSWDKASKVVGVTDWLLGKAKRKDDKAVDPGLVLGCCDDEAVQRRIHPPRRGG